MQPAGDDSPSNDSRHQLAMSTGSTQVRYSRPRPGPFPVEEAVWVLWVFAGLQEPLLCVQPLDLPPEGPQHLQPPHSGTSAQRLPNQASGAQKPVCINGASVDMRTRIASQTGSRLSDLHRPQCLRPFAVADGLCLILYRLEVLLKSRLHEL